MESSRSLPMVALLLATLGTVGCSSESGGGGPGGGPGDTPAVFSGYCTGTLTTSVELMHPMPPSGWMGDGSRSAAAGTTVLLGDGFKGWDGYVFDADGTPLKSSDDLVKGTHFTSDCAPDGPPNSAAMVRVLLADSTFYPSLDLSGAPCTLPAGTAFLGSFSYVASGEAGSVSADEIKATCKLDDSYSGDILYEELIPLK